MENWSARNIVHTNFPFFDHEENHYEKHYFFVSIAVDNGGESVWNGTCICT